MAKLIQGLILFAAGIMLWTSCKEGTSENGPGSYSPDTSVQSKVLKVGNASFSIPSPLRIALMVKDSKAKYKKDVWASLPASASYPNEIRKGFNLGISGADLGYCLVFGQTQDALLLLKRVKELTSDLGINFPADGDLMERFSSNISNPDSTMVLFSEFFRRADDILKSNKREPLNLAVMTGLWLEGLNFLCSNPESPERNARIGEMKISLDMLVKLLDTHLQHKDLTELNNLLANLVLIYDEVPLTNVFVPSTHEASQKITHIHSQTKVSLNSETVKKISTEVNQIKKTWI